MTGHNDDEHEPLVSVGDSVKDYSNEDNNPYIVSTVLIVKYFNYFF